jgi:hypothetical protein
LTFAFFSNTVSAVGISMLLSGSCYFGADFCPKDESRLGSTFLGLFTVSDASLDLPEVSVRCDGLRHFKDFLTNGFLCSSYSFASFSSTCSLMRSYESLAQDWASSYDWHSKRLTFTCRLGLGHCCMLKSGDPIFGTLISLATDLFDL